MKNKNLILRYLGLFFLVSSIALNIRMIVIQAWPTYLFYLLSGIGILQILASFFLKQMKVIWQIITALVLIIPILYLLFF